MKIIKELLTDERGVVSSKRLVGILCAIVLCTMPFITSYINPPQYIVESIGLLAFGCLGLSSVDKATKKKTE